MPGIGYSEGYLEALSTLSGVSAQQQAVASSRQQMQMRQKEQQDQAQEKSILADVFRSRAGDQQILDEFGAADKLAQQYREAGRKLMGTSPQDALNFLKEGDQLQHKTATNRLEAAREEKIKGDYLAGLAMSVGSQAELSAFVKAAAKAGRTIDPKMHVWNEATAKGLERFAKSTLTYSKQQELELRSKEIGTKTEAEARKKKWEEEKERDDKRKDERAKEAIKIRERTAETRASKAFDLNPGNKNAMDAERKTMLDTDKTGDFKKLPPGVQNSAMEDARQIAKRMFAEQTQSVLPEDRLTEEDIMQEARKEAIAKWSLTQTGMFGQNTEATRKPGGVEGKGEDGKLPATRTVAGTAYYLHADGKYYTSKEE